MVTIASVKPLRLSDKYASVNQDITGSDNDLMLVDTKQLSKPVLDYSQLDPYEQT